MISLCLAVWCWGVRDNYLPLQAYLITLQILPGRSLLHQFIPHLIHLLMQRET